MEEQRQSARLLGTLARAILRGLGRRIVSRAWRCWGLGCFIQLLDVYIGIPSLEHSAQFAVERLDARLQQQMRTALAPLHLLLLAESFAHDLVHRRFHEPRGYGLTVPIGRVPALCG